MFRDRVEAGQRLADRLTPWNLAPSAGPPVVLGLPRGGMPVAAEVARAVGGQLDVLVIRKIGVPWQPELALGAVGEGGVRVLNDRIADATGLTGPETAELTARAEREVQARVDRWRQGREPVPLTGRVAVLVDDGIATGATMRAAVDVVRARTAGAVVIAVPVASTEAIDQLQSCVDELICLLVPRNLVGVGLWYRDFTQTTDAEVADLLAAATS